MTLIQQLTARRDEDYDVSITAQRRVDHVDLELSDVFITQTHV